MILALGIPLFVVAVIIVSAGMPGIQHAASHGFLKYLVNAVKFLGDKENWVLQQAVKLTKWVSHELGPVYQAVYGRGTSWIATLNHYVYVTGYWSLYWPIALKHEVDHLRQRTIPRTVDARTKPLRQQVAQAEAEAKAAAGQAHSQVSSPPRPGTVQRVTKVERVAMPHAREWEWIHDHWQATKAVILGVAAGAVAEPLPHAPALPIPWGRTVKQIRRRLHRVEALLGVTAFAAVLAQVLGVTARCLRPSGPIGKTARRLCGMPARALEDFLGLLVDWFILTNICEVITLLDQGLSLIEPEITALIDTADAMFVHCGYELPAKRALPLYLPPNPSLRLVLS